VSRPDLNELVLRIEFNDQGSATYVKRECRSCGGGNTDRYALNEVLPSSQLGAIVQEHLVHCDKGHNIRPKVMCGLKVHVVVGDVEYSSGSVRHPMTCTLEKHDIGIRHHFELAVVQGELRAR
jgi:hypothetical protein